MNPAPADTAPRPRISVAMATYNGARHLREQLESLARQQRLPDELVVCDDGSSDGTVELLEQFAGTAPFRVRIRRNERNLGVLRNFEKALSLCEGDIVFMSDQDDVWLPEKIGDVVGVFDKIPDALAVINDKLIADENLVPTGATMLGNVRGFGSPDGNFVAGCCSAFRREWLQIALPIPEGAIAHDTWLVGLAHRLQVASIREKPLQYYRRHESNVSQNAYSEQRPVGPVRRLATEIGGILNRSPDGDDADWQSFVDSNEAEARRIGERREVLDRLGLGARADSALKLLRRQGETLTARRGFAAAAFPRRAAGVWKLWRSGGYAPFSGWKSALKDLLR
ncbi:MAG TPA: glycosyltransferase family 2 protein [Allosphingosinicella sp.]|nr:glycosyltransferase family 2 protein [Allosphingosinicella sp.]